MFTPDPLSNPLPKFCVNCTHYASSVHGVDKAKCLAPQNKDGYNLVSGEVNYYILYCVDARKSTNVPEVLKTACGFNAIWFIQRPIPIPIPNALIPPSRSEQSTVPKNYSTVSRRATKFNLDDL